MSTEQNPEKPVENGAPESSLAKRYSFKLLANIINIPIYLLMEAILPRALGTAAYGVYGYATGMFQYLINLLDGGTSTCLFTSLAKRRNEWGLIAFYGLISLVLLFIIMLASGITAIPAVAASAMPDVPLWAIPLAALWAYLTWGVRTLRGINDALGQTIPSEKARMIASFLGLGSLVLLYALGVLNLATLFIQQALFLLGMCLAFQWIVYKDWRGPRPFPDAPARREYTREFTRYSTPIFMRALVVAFFLMAERWLLQTTHGSIEQGYFTLSQKTGMACFLFVSAMTPLLMREFSMAHGRKDLAAMGAMLERFAPMFYSVAAYFSVFICLEAESVVRILGGPNFMAAVPAVLIMALYPIHQGYGQLTESVYYAAAQTRMLRTITITSSLIGFAGAWVVIAPPAWGGLNYAAAGLALKSVAIQALTVNISLYCCSRIIPLRLSRLWLHQLLALLFFAAAAAAPLALGKLFPNLWVIPGLHPSAAMQEILGLGLRGLVYTALVTGGVLLCPWLVGMTKADLRKLFGKVRRKRGGKTIRS